MSEKRHTAADEPHFLIRTLAAEFPNGRKLEPHSHPWGQLIYAMSGVMSVWTTEGSWVAPPHWAVWAPAGVRHSIHFTGATSLRTLYFRPGLQELAPSSSVIAVSPLLRELIHSAVAIGFLDDREPLHSAMTELIANELRAHPAAALDLRWPQSASLRRVAEHLSKAPGDRADHAGLAKRFGVGARTIERGFAAETGLTLGQWRRQARFLHALRRLGVGSAVKEAAVEAGYRSPSAFIGAFRAAFGSTPGRYFQACAATPDK